MTNSQQQEQLSSACCADFCARYFETEETTVVNQYKCNDRKLAVSDLWRIQKQRKQYQVNTGL